MRVALLSDIHGNVIALEAVLASIASEGGADEYWILGDLVALGPDPVGVMEHLAPLPGLRMIRGNTDRYVVSGDRPSPTLDEARQDPKLLSSLVEVANTFAWTQGMVTAAGWLDRLKALPLELRLTLPDGTRFLGVHASPQHDDGTGVYPGIKDHELEALFRLPSETMAKAFLKCPAAGAGIPVPGAAGDFPVVRPFHSPVFWVRAARSRCFSPPPSVAKTRWTLPDLLLRPARCARTLPGRPHSP